ncbi:MAG: cob(I)yrinic acid a,c-diamide adenosyltransferase [Bacteroidia bacterium]|nr:cob(I)yrinic acid a,c-diamide adenosyltransferase [Bacteroidia bacterium]
MKIYTKTGDEGTTGLLGGTRVEKHHIRINAYGTIDELNSWIGLLRDQKISKVYKGELIAIQNNLFTLGSRLATDPEKKTLKSGAERVPIKSLSEEDVVALEMAIDSMNNVLPPMTHFILPGGHDTVSYCHICRTLCRRAERRMTELHAQQPINRLFLSYINRLSDYLFVLARKLSADLYVDEVKWIPEKKST